MGERAKAVERAARTANLDVHVKQGLPHLKEGGSAKMRSQIWARNRMGQRVGDATPLHDVQGIDLHTAVRVIGPPDEKCGLVRRTEGSQL